MVRHGKALSVRWILAEQRRTFSDCKNGGETCDYSKLTPPEARTLAVAEHKGYGYCDPTGCIKAQEAQIPDHI